MDMKNKLLNLLEEPRVLQWLVSNPSCSWKSFPALWACWVCNECAWRPQRFILILFVTGKSLWALLMANVLVTCCSFLSLWCGQRSVRRICWKAVLWGCMFCKWILKALHANIMNYWQRIEKTTLNASKRTEGKQLSPFFTFSLIPITI